MTYEELDQMKRDLQRRRQDVVNKGNSPKFLDIKISKTQREMNKLTPQREAGRNPECGEGFVS